MSPKRSKATGKAPKRATVGQVVTLLGGRMAVQAEALRQLADLLEESPAAVLHAEYQVTQPYYEKLRVRVRVDLDPEKAAELLEK